MIQVGDRVRSFDFDSREVVGETACFVEGVVQNITNPAIDTMFRDCAHYEIRVERRVFGGVEMEVVGGLVYPPVNGIPSTFGNVTNYVELA
tara:strand:+ start:534 stop:806 length:273 start_codon:yes stop_codon:yes gene_type:complete